MIFFLNLSFLQARNQLGTFEVEALSGRGFGKLMDFISEIEFPECT